MKVKMKFVRLLGNRKMRIGRFALLLLFGGAWTWFFLPVPIYGVLNLGNGCGMLLFGGLFLLTLFWTRVSALVKQSWQKKGGRVFLSVFLTLCILGTGASLALTGLIVREAKNAPPDTTPVTVVVLGCQVRRDERPSLMLTRRLEAAYGYLSANPETVCILSGGKGTDEPVSEADAMFTYLTGRGIDEERLLKEEASTSTRENLRFSADMIRERGLSETVVLITNEFHQYRAGLLADGEGLTHYAVNGASPRILLPTYVVREFFGIVYEVLIGKGR